MSSNFHAPTDGLARVEEEIHQQPVPLSNARAKRKFLLHVLPIYSIRRLFLTLKSYHPSTMTLDSDAPTTALARVEEEIHQQTVFLSNLRAKRKFLVAILPVYSIRRLFLTLKSHHASSDSNAPTDPLSRVEAEIHQQTVFLSNLRAKRNSHLPVFRLPPEIIAIIFIYGARDYYESVFGGRVTRDIPTWVHVSYICHHWRNIALNCPTLWTYHFHLSLRWTEELLLRSKQAPLKISCISSLPWFPGNDRWSYFLDRFLKHSDRIQELCLSLPPQLLPAKLPLSAPYLERLEIEVRIWDSSVEPLVITDGDKLPLRILKLANCSLPWCSLNLVGLKTLYLRNVHSPFPLNIVKFLTILSGMRDLIVLYLEDVLPSARGFLSSGGLGISSKIDLPHLTHLAIIAPLSAVVALLSCVNIPLKTQLRLEPQFERGYSVDDYRPIVSFIAQSFNVSEEWSSPDPIRSLIINTRVLSSSTLERDCKHRFAAILENWDHDIPLQVILGTSAMEDMGERLTESGEHRIMSNICCSLPSTNVQTLHVIQPKFSSAIWKEILGHLDGLRYMKLSNGCMPDLSFLSLIAHELKENLSGQLPHDQGSTQGHMFVPALEELELCGIKFMDDHIPWEGGMSKKALFDAISTRKGLRDRLTMIGCWEA